MRKFLITVAACGALFALPSLASAEDAAAGAAVGAGTGAVAGAVVGGPVGAVVGAGVGGAVGASATDRPRRDERVIVEPRAQVTERSCVRDATGASVCTTVRQ